MTLQSSGSISIGNVSTELGYGSTTQRSLNDTTSRNLAGVASGAISLSNFYGKTKPVGVSYTPAPGSYSDVEQGQAQYSISCNQSVVWTYTKSDARVGWGTISDQNGAAFTSGGTATMLTMMVSGTASVSKSNTFTVQSGGNTWSIYLEGDASATCVTVDTILPGYAYAGMVKVGDYLKVGNPLTFDTRDGLVSRSDIGPDDCVRITTQSGITLECSRTAPIATQDGSCVIAPNLVGYMVPVYDRGDNRYEPVITVESIGVKDVVHITCENDVFLAGAQVGRYLLHHNIKNL